MLSPLQRIMVVATIFPTLTGFIYSINISSQYLQEIPQLLQQPHSLLVIPTPWIAYLYVARTI